MKAYVLSTLDLQIENEEQARLFLNKQIQDEQIHEFVLYNYTDGTPSILTEEKRIYLAEGIERLIQMYNGTIKSSDYEFLGEMEDFVVNQLGDN